MKVNKLCKFIIINSSILIHRSDNSNCCTCKNRIFHNDYLLNKFITNILVKVTFCCKKLTEKNGKYTFVMPAGKVTVKSSFAEEAPEQIFADVPVDAYYYEAVKWAAEKGITGGTGNGLFSPDATCSRAQIVAFLWRSEKSPAAGSRNLFADVKSSAYYADAVLWAAKEDITKGTTNTTFSPNTDCTRSQIVTFLWRCKK